MEVVQEDRQTFRNNERKCTVYCKGREIGLWVRELHFDDYCTSFFALFFILVKNERAAFILKGFPCLYAQYCQ